MKSIIIFLAGAAFGSSLLFFIPRTPSPQKGPFVTGMVNQLIQENVISEPFIEGFVENNHVGAIAFRNQNRQVFTLAHKQGIFPKIIIEHGDNTISLFFSGGKDVTIGFNPETREGEFLSVTTELDAGSKSFVDRGLTGRFDEMFIFDKNGAVERVLIEKID
jgi:hypothetical protein